MVNEKQEGGLQRWFRETRGELRKVTWPTREEAIRLTYVVIGISVALGGLLGAVDSLLTAMYGLVVK